MKSTDKFNNIVPPPTYHRTISITVCILAALAMFLRMFYGTEITDESYYISDALTAMHGNYHFAYSNGLGIGCGLLMIPFLFFYELFVPSCEGIVLYSRLCYIIFWCVCMMFACRILMKDFKKSTVLLVTAFMIAFAGASGSSLFNFSYNTVPCAFSYLSAVFIYDAIEHYDKNTCLKLFSAGFMMGMALLGHIGSGLTIALLACLILLRSRSLKAKLLNLSCCMAGGLVQLITVFVPIAIQTGLPPLLAGIDNIIHPYPVQRLTNDSIWDRLSVILRLYCLVVPFCAAVFFIVFFLSRKFVKENGSPLSKKAYTILSATLAIGLPVLYCCFLQTRHHSPRAGLDWGFFAGIAIPFLFCIKDHKKFPILLYVGIYPLAFALGEMILTESNASIARLQHAVPAQAIFFLVMLNEEGKLSLLLNEILLTACIASTLVNNYLFFFFDESHISNLDHRVESGVYKGIYTTEERASNLPELEKYLNNIIDEKESYAFRDNVPTGYLMVRNGIMCDIATWDRMQYSYGLNAPANLYAYYKRKRIIPNKIIYVDFGRDEMLSIDKKDFKFNEFVNSYYKKTRDFAMNSTFKRVAVYEYKGGFDGNLDYWIDRHMLRNGQ